MTIDVWLTRLLPACGSHPALDIAMVVATTVGLLALGVLAPACVWRRDRRLGWAFIATLAAGLGASLVLQLLVARPRPNVLDPLLPVPALPSFPSGHAVLVASAVVFAFAYRQRAGWLSIPVALVVMASRVYLGHHYGTDVLGGALLGLGLGMGGVAAARAADDDPWRRRWVLWPQLGLVATISLAAYNGTLSSADPAWLRLPGMDKFLHFLLFGAIAFGTHFATRGRALQLRVWSGRTFALPWSVVAPLVLALADEGVQALSAHRTADPIDLLADLLGLLAFRWLATR